MLSFLASLVVAATVAGPVCFEGPGLEMPGVSSDTLPDLYEGVGEGAHARLRFFFEVTFLKIDIGWIEACPDPASASLLKRVAAEDYSKGRARALEMALLDGNPMLLRLGDLAQRKPDPLGVGDGRILTTVLDRLSPLDYRGIQSSRPVEG